MQKPKPFGGRNLFEERGRIMAIKERIDLEESSNPLDDASDLVRQIADVKIELETIEMGAKNQIENIRKNAENESKPLIEKIDKLMKKLFSLCQKKRQVLFSGKKSFKTSAGTVSFKKTRPQVKVLDEEKAIEELVQKGLGKFIRAYQVKEIDKNAIASNRDKFDGLKYLRIEQEEQFAVKPKTTRIITRLVDALKKRMRP